MENTLCIFLSYKKGDNFVKVNIITMLIIAWKKKIIQYFNSKDSL